MTKYDTKLFQIILGHESFCSLCLENIENSHKSYFIEDKITLENETRELGDLLRSVMGEEMVLICASGIVCEQCTREIINIYNFIATCKQNNLNLYKSVASLEENTRDNIADPNMFKSLFILLNQDDFSITQYYDSKSVFANNAEALVQFKKILNIEQTKFKQDGQDREDLDEAVDNKLSKVKKKSKLKRKLVTGPGEKINKQKNKNKVMTEPKAKPMSTKAMLYDENDHSTIKCKVCLQAFPRLQNLRQHYIKIHAPKVFNCSECTSSFGSATLLTSHKSDYHTPSVCPECGKIYTFRSSFYIHMKTHNIKNVCNNCGKKFKHKRNYNRHIELKICDKSHKKSLPRKYICDYCNKDYTCKTVLRSHIKCKHLLIKSVECLCCKKLFPTQSKMLEHSVKHTKEKKFNCDVCGGHFVTKLSLVQHMRLHTGETPYQCEHCDLQFSTVSRRIAHVNRHHRSPMFECDVCPSKFTSKFCLNRHKSRHLDPNSRMHTTFVTLQEKL